MASKKKGKTFAAKRTVNPPGARRSSRAEGSAGAPFQEQDPKRRLGGYGGKGEHPRTGNRGRR